MATPQGIKSKQLSRLVGIQADDSGNLPDSIELLQTGMWDAPYHGVFMISPTDLQEYVDNFNNDVRASSSTMGLPIDYEHDVDGGAAGWIMGLKIGPASDPAMASQGVQSLFANVKWTPPGAQAILDGVYQFISPEFCPDEYIDPEGIAEACDNVLIGAGLTNRPLFKGLKPLMASDDAHKGGEDGDKIYINLKENKPVDLSQIRTKAASELSDDEKKFLEENQGQLSADEKAKFGFGSSAEPVAPATNNTSTAPVAPVTPTAPVTANDLPKDVHVLSASDYAALTEKANAGAKAASLLEGMQASDHINSLCFNEETGVKFQAGAKDELVEFYLSCSEDQRKKFDKLVGELKPVVSASDFSASGAAGEPAENSAQAQLTVKANELMEKDKELSFAQAMVQASAADPALANAYAAEVKQGVAA